MSRLEDKAEDAAFGFFLAMVVIAVIVMALLYVAAWAALIAVVVGLVWGIVKYLVCAYSKRTIVANIKRRRGSSAFKELCSAHYSVVEDADLQMDIWLNKGIGDYVAPGDDVPPRSSYGFVRFASWPFLIRWIPCLAYLMFTAWLRVGFMVCFAFSAAKFGISWLIAKFGGGNERRSEGRKEEKQEEEQE